MRTTLCRRQFRLELVADPLPRHPAYRVVVAGQRFALHHFSLEIAEDKPCHYLHLRNAHFILNGQPTVVTQDSREPVPVILQRRLGSLFRARAAACDG